MQYPSYPFQQHSSTSEFFFESIGPKGIIQKVVIITPIDQDDIFNMALVDIDLTTGLLDDKSVSDNGDTPKVLATIFQITRQYLTNHPTHKLYFEGNTHARNRLYRMAISQAIEELSDYFAMFGFYNQQWEAFRPNHPYESYLILNK